MSEIPLQHLYVITGETGPKRERTQAALEYLLSEKAEGLGEKLLREAYAQTGKPVTIEVYDGLKTGYENAKGEHTIFFNPTVLEKSVERAADGSIFSLSIEAHLVHELTHAADPATNDVISFNKLEAVRDRIQTAATDPEKVASMRRHIAEAQRVPHRYGAQKATAKAVAEARVILEEVLAKIDNDPEYQAFVAKVEAPAVANEARIQRSLGLPVRARYCDLNVDDEVQRYSEQIAHAVDWATKKNLAPESADRWQRFVGDASELRPEIAQQQGSRFQRLWTSLTQRGR